MSPAARSIFVFGARYPVLLNACLMPRTEPRPGTPFGFPPTNEVLAARCRAAETAIIGWRLFWSHRGTATPESFFRATLVARPFLVLSLCGYVLFGLAPPQLILFGVIDLAGALWTWLALRRKPS